MKNNKMFIFSLVLIFTGILGGGLFAVATSLQKIADEIGNKTETGNITCGTILFILLAIAVIGMVMMICEIFGKKEEK